jgi:hypothetical protein
VSRAGVDGTAVGGAAVGGAAGGGAGVGGALGSSVAAVEAVGWSAAVGSLKEGLRWSTAMAAVAALAASAPAVVDATVCVDFFLRSHSSRFCLRLWFAGRCLPCFLGALAAVEVWHTSRVSTAPHTVLNSSLAAMPLATHD